LGIQQWRFFTEVAAAVAQTRCGWVPPTLLALTDEVIE
jgi:hypothetical protein